MLFPAKCFEIFLDPKTSPESVTPLRSVPPSAFMKPGDGLDNLMLDDRVPLLGVQVDASGLLELDALGLTMGDNLLGGGHAGGTVTRPRSLGNLGLDIEIGAQGEVDQLVLRVYDASKTLHQDGAPGECVFVTYPYHCGWVRSSEMDFLD